MHLKRNTKEKSVNERFKWDFEMTDICADVGPPRSNGIPKQHNNALTKHVRLKQNSRRGGAHGVD
jgi:hypothetical protein